jgi:hypothetical protein
MRHETHVLQDVSITFRLSDELDRTMRDSAEFFGRSLGAEWRAAAEVYRRVLMLWSTTLRADDSPTPDRADEEVRNKLVHTLCDGLVRAPASVNSLRRSLTHKRC